VVAGGRDEDLGLVHEAAEGFGVKHPVAVALKSGAEAAFGFRNWTLRFPAPCACRSEDFVFSRFDPFPDRQCR
jgi:hypothetical protein